MYTLVFIAALSSSVSNTVNYSTVVPNLDKETCTQTLRDLANSNTGNVRFSRCVPQADVSIKNQKELDNLIDKVK